MMQYTRYNFTYNNVTILESRSIDGHFLLLHRGRIKYNNAVNRKEYDEKAQVVRYLKLLSKIADKIDFDKMSAI